MKVLLRIRSDVKAFPGGDYVQLLQTQRALENAGVTCEVSAGVDPIPQGIDIVHLFNTTRIHETYLQFSEAKKKGFPVVLSPIWHSLKEMARFYAKLYRLPFFPISSYLALKEIYYAGRSNLQRLLAATLRFTHLQRMVVEGCDAVLPNSQPELQILCDELKAKPRASFVVPPSFDLDCKGHGSSATRDGVLCVGRIEPRKNQLSVIRAFKALPRSTHRLVIYGAINEAHPAYAKKVQQELVHGWVEYGGHVPREEIYLALSKAKALVLASYFETCGYAAMEALSCGAHVCISDTPYTRGFYQAAVSYCNPYCSDSISRGIDSALRKSDADYSDLLRQYSAENTAAQTLEAYKFALN